MTTTVTIYRLTTAHAQSSHGQPVAIDAEGNAYGPEELGLWGRLGAHVCGRVDYVASKEDAMAMLDQTRSQRGGPGDDGGGIYWSGFGDTPDRMWRAVLRAYRDGARHLIVQDAGAALVW